MTTDTRICRLCDENNDHLYNIFEKNVFDIQIINMIKDCLPILIYRKDPLSKFICHSCNENLNMFVEFKKTCLETANKHREELQLLHSADPTIELYLKQIEEVNFNDHNIIIEENHAENSKSQDFASLPSENSMDYDRIPNNETGGSEMDVDDTMTSDTTFNAAVSAIYTNQSSITNKPRISGPKSVTNAYQKRNETEETVYQPMTLFEIIVHRINKMHLPHYNNQPYIKEIKITEQIHYCCRYCEEMFDSEVTLAEHESEHHIRLTLTKVDEGPLWTSSLDCFNIRNGWMKSQEKKDDKLEEEQVDAEGGEEELLMPIKNETVEELPTLDVSRNCIIYFVGEVPYANGMPLEDVPKETRNSFYQSVKMQGLKRKFCQLCRYTFKDNWSIDTHYFKSNCYFTCNYCGAKFKRSKHEYLPHIREHQLAGHEKSMSVFASNDRGDIIEYDTNCLETYVPMVNQYPPRQMKPLPPKPTPMKLRMRQVLPKVEPEDIPPSPPMKQPAPPVEKRGHEPTNKLNSSNDLAKNQAYFCKKCYQVFTKLDSYNTHIKTCNGEILDDPEMSVIRHYNKKDGSSPLFCSKVKPATQYRKNVTKKMPPLNPLPHGVKIKQERPENGILHKSITNPPGAFPCNHCTAVFQTVYSRNSHMRIHVKHKQQMAHQQASQKRPGPIIMQPTPKKIKQESFEPIVEIHEGSSKVPSIIGSVSITPIKRISNGGALNVSPDIMKLVQNNPNITFKPRERRQEPESVQSSSVVLNSSQSGDESDFKTYKCSSCTQHFANKSNLYFHKKNQCTGSRYPCPFCKKRFGTASEYSAHIYYSHPE